MSFATSTRSHVRTRGPHFRPKQAFAGVMAAMVTPLNEDETIDVEGVERLVERLIQAGIEGIFAGGTIGEGVALRDSQRAVLVREIVRTVGGRIPVLANVSDTGTVRVLDQIRQMQDAGANMVVVTGRFGFPLSSAAGTYRLIEAVARESACPICFYENPVVSSVKHTLEDIRQIVAINNVRALKFSSSDRELYARCVKEFPHLPVLNGNVSDIAFAASAGGAGVISGIGSLAPRLCIRAFEAGKSGDKGLADKLQADLASLYSIYGGDGWPLWPTAQKYVLKRLGVLRTCAVTSPFVQLSKTQEAQLDSIIEKFEPELFAA